MKKILFAALISTTLVSFAVTTSHYQVFDPVKEGLPVADGGIQVKPLIKILKPTSKTALSVSSNKILMAQKEIREKGYFEVDNPEARTIMNMRNIQPLKPGSNKPEDTNLKSTIEDVGLAFEFKGIPVEPKNVIGYAAGGLYKDGWTAVTEIFTDKDLGTCQYALFNIKLSHGSEFVPQELVRYDVNGKVTVLDVRGNVNSGYLYNIHWADNNTMNDLLCSNMTFDRAKTDKLIALAKSIDKSVVLK